MGNDFGALFLKLIFLEIAGLESALSQNFFDSICSSAVRRCKYSVDQSMWVRASKFAHPLDGLILQSLFLFSPLQPNQSPKPLRSWLPKFSLFAIICGAI